MSRHILLTFDVEDWFQVENFKSCIPFSTWESRELRVEQSTHTILDLLDDVKEAHSSQPENSSQFTVHSSQLKRKEGKSSRVSAAGKNSSQPAEAHSSQLIADSKEKEARFAVSSGLQPPTNIRATFFILGWLAERLPGLVREIHARGHEVASHGSCHELCTTQSTSRLLQDLQDSKKLLEDICGAQVQGYRAPSFSINKDVLELIRQCGYSYDSSYNSFALHGRYGRMHFNGAPKEGVAYRLEQDFFELPISNLKVKGRIFPLGGGGYFRLLPQLLFIKGVGRILEAEKGYVFYMHPWEFDPEQPRVSQAPLKYRFRHYINLNKTADRLHRLIRAFSDCRFVTCSEYLGVAPRIQ